MDSEIRISQPDEKVVIVVSHAAVGDEIHPELLALTVAYGKKEVGVALSQEMVDVLMKALAHFRPSVPMGDKVYSDMYTFVDGGR